MAFLIHQQACRAIGHRSPHRAHSIVPQQQLPQPVGPRAIYYRSYLCLVHSLSLSLAPPKLSEGQSQRSQMMATIDVMSNKIQRLEELLAASYSSCSASSSFVFTSPGSGLGILGSQHRALIPLVHWTNLATTGSWPRYFSSDGCTPSKCYATDCFSFTGACSIWHMFSNWGNQT